jgi:alkylation response protein AidB-like acyl-CoA dehydrogenase
MADSATLTEVADDGWHGFGELRSAAQESSDLARSVARITEEQRSLGSELAGRLTETGLLRTGVPQALGGAQAPPSVILRTAETVARGDASAGWCVAIATTSSLLSAYLPDKGAKEVFGDPQSVAAGVWAPRGKAQPVEGGVTVSGRWAFCSGISHADWLFAGCVLDTGEPKEGGAPVLRVAAIPTSQLKILDTWRTGGLRGTGSHDAVASEVFVPDHRLMSVTEGPPEDAAPLYQFPLFGFFALSVASAALGNARGAIDDLVSMASSQKPSGSSRSLAERSSTQAAVARAEASLRAARLLFYQSVEDAWRAAHRSEPVSEELRVGLRLAATHAARTAADVVSSMYELGGGASIYEDSPLQRRFRDAHTVTAHLQVKPATYEVTGRFLLGLPIETAQL